MTFPPPAIAWSPGGLALAAAERRRLSDAAAIEHNERRSSRCSGASDASSTEASPRTAKHMTTSQIKRTLREAGVEVPEGAARAELEALLERV